MFSLVPAISFETISSAIIFETLSNSKQIECHVVVQCPNSESMNRGSTGVGSRCCSVCFYKLRSLASRDHPVLICNSVLVRE